jgi:hypothetical protein
MPTTSLSTTLAELTQFARRITIAAAALSACAYADVPVPQGSGEPVSVCTLLQNQSTYDGTRVTIDARVETDAIEHTFVGDAHDNPYCSILLGGGRGPVVEEHLAELRAATTKAHHTSSEGHHLFAYARLVGVFRKDPSGGAYRSALEVTDATSIRIAEGPDMVPPVPPKNKRS